MEVNGHQNGLEYSSKIKHIVKAHYFQDILLYTNRFSNLKFKKLK